MLSLKFILKYLSWVMSQYNFLFNKLTVSFKLWKLLTGSSPISGSYKNIFKPNFWQASRFILLKWGNGGKIHKVRDYVHYKPRNSKEFLVNSNWVVKTWFFILSFCNFRYLKLNYDEIFQRPTECLNSFQSNGLFINYLV